MSSVIEPGPLFWRVTTVTPSLGTLQAAFGRPVTSREHLAGQETLSVSRYESDQLSGGFRAGIAENGSSQCK
jgi:hypothetical protein